MTEWLLVLAGVALTFGTAVFVAAEFSFVALDKPTVQRAVDEGDHAAGRVLTSLRQLSTQLSAAQVGITLTTLVLGFIAEPSVGRLLATPVAAVGVPPGAVEPVSAGLALFLATVFSMIFGELVPQFLGISEPLGMAKLVAVPVRLFSVLTRPLIVVLNGSANLVLKAFGITPQEELSGARTPQELASLVRRSAEAGTLDETTARLVTRSLDFGEQTAADVMTPRVRCTAIERTASAADVLRLARRTGHSRFPVIGEDWDDVDGLVHVKRAIAVPHERREDVPVSALMINPTLVPETIRLDPLLLLLRGSGMQLAVVVDEYGGTSGLVTLEDVIEEIVGEVSDEHDRSRTTGREMTDGSWTVPGLWRPDEVHDRLGADVPEGPAYETVGGFVMAALGRVPVVGDTVTVPGWTVRVEAMDGRRVDRLRFTPHPPEPDDEAGTRHTGTRQTGERAEERA
ncbi:hemolysin family protein [Oryzihumus leptocrescens]|uniref:CBS domain containing-hemolysin-like protein n=1 Tax=Oryzihumus leptocrescens TaxID=297536 RepID=A0A542ZLW6_9MICO|nr:hemolysin family protein [Oryzihumus leptocrescens]TQL61354.1 CBS domain containing-hemolysin-like protein [Oryzihumus leptocrescens]